MKKKQNNTGNKAFQKMYLDQHNVRQAREET
jgi:hypothetical protein